MDIECGTDIIEIYRIKEAIETSKEAFINRIFTQNEVKYCESKKMMKYQHYAARFAAKEAVYKAISPNDCEFCWKNIEIINNEFGKPEVFLHNEIENLKNKLNIKKIVLSLSHCKEYATASAILMKGEQIDG